MAPAVTVPRRGRSAVLANLADGGVGRRTETRVGPFHLFGFCGGAPGKVLLTGPGEEFIAGVLEAVSQVEMARAFGDQRAVPRALPPLDLAAGGVERESRGTKVAHRPRLLGLHEPQQVQEVVRRVRGAGAQPSQHTVQFGQQGGALVAIGGPGLPGQAKPVQRVGQGAHGKSGDDGQQSHRHRAVSRHLSRVAEDGRGDRPAQVDVYHHQGVPRVPVSRDHFGGRG